MITLPLVVTGLIAFGLGALVVYALLVSRHTAAVEDLRRDLDAVRQSLAETSQSQHGLEIEAQNLREHLDNRMAELERARAQVAALQEAGGDLNRQFTHVDTLLSQERESHAAKIQDLGDQMRMRQAELNEARAQIAELQTGTSDLGRKLTHAETLLKQERESHQEKIRELSDVRNGIEEKLKLLASDVLQKNTDGFLKRAQEYFEGHKQASAQSVETLVKPIGEALKTYQNKLAEMEQVRKRDEGEIVQQLRQVAETHLRLKDTTSNLVNALRAAPKTRGRWGEQQLKTVLEMAGMMENVDFLTEHTVEAEDRKLRPDVVLRLPGGRQIVVDAKTPMSAYLDAVEAPEEDERERFLRLHAQQLRTHVQQLGSKQYWDQFAEAPDFVVMFVPGENLYGAAIERDPELFEFAYDKQVIVATPTTFLALAKAIAFGWRQERASQNAQKVLSEGGELYKRLQGLGEKVLKLSKSLDQTVGRHNELVASLETRVMPQGRKLHEMGVGSSVGELERLDLVERTPRAPLPGKDLILSASPSEDETPELPLTARPGA